MGITKDGETGKITIDEVTYDPIFMYRGPAGKLQRYKVIDIETAIQKYEDGSDKSLGQTTYSTIKEALTDIKKILGDEILKTEPTVSEELNQSETE